MDPQAHQIFDSSVPAAQESKARLRNSLGKATKPPDFEKAQMSFYGDVNSIIAKRLAESGDKIDCKAGCYFCCFMKVDAMPIEVFLIVETLKRKFSPEQVQATHTKAKENRRRISGMTAEQQKATPMACPLLVNNQCSVYEVRPVMCRKHHSADVKVCEKMLTEPEKEVPRPEVLEITYSFPPFFYALEKAYSQEGFDPTPYDLASALDEALENPKCYKRWRAKKSPFPKEIMAKDWKESSVSIPALDD